MVNRIARTEIERSCIDTVPDAPAAGVIQKDPSEVLHDLIEMKNELKRVIKGSRGRTGDTKELKTLLSRTESTIKELSDVMNDPDIDLVSNEDILKGRE